MQRLSPRVAVEKKSDNWRSLSPRVAAEESDNRLKLYPKVAVEKESDISPYVTVVPDAEKLASLLSLQVELGMSILPRLCSLFLCFAIFFFSRVSPKYLADKIERLKLILRNKGHPDPIVDRVVQKTLEKGPVLAGESKKVEKPPLDLRGWVLPRLPLRTRYARQRGRSRLTQGTFVV